MDRYEYSVLKIPRKAKNIEEAFDELGKDGWELIAIDQAFKGLAYFKRKYK